MEELGKKGEETKNRKLAWVKKEKKTMRYTIKVVKHRYGFIDR